MILAKIKICGVRAVPICLGDIPKGIIGATVRLEYADPIWDGLSKTVVFKGSGVTKDVLNAGEVVEVPAEVVTRSGGTLLVGVYGTNADGVQALPTLWADLGRVRDAADPSGDESTDPTLPVWAQLQEQIDDLQENGIPGGGGGGGITKEKDPTVPAWAKQPNPPTYTAQDVGADAAGTAERRVADHNTDASSHSDIRLELKALSDRINAALDSDDTTLDELSEIVAYIKSNKSLIEAVTTSKISVTDIVDNLITNVANKPLSAAQGVILKGLIEEVRNLVPTDQHINSLIDAKLDDLPGSGGNADLTGYATEEYVQEYAQPKGKYLTEHQDISGKLDASALPTAINTALAQAKASGEFDGIDGKDGVDGKDGYTPVKGVDYFDGNPGKDGVDGYTPVKGKDYFDGKDGKDGSPGVDGSDGITPHIGSNGNWFVGNTDTGKPSRGADGQPGQDGSAGKDGTSVTVKSVSESTADGGRNVVTFSDGKTLTVKNGETGANGKTAYQYAQDGGYTGTESEFAEKLANEYNLNPLYGKKISLVGDSICAGADDDTSYLGGYGKIIADRNSMVYENLAKGGETVTAETYSSSTGTAKGWLCRMVDSMSADADYAIIEGGVNDAWQFSDHGTIDIGKISAGFDAALDDTTYYGAFESMLKKLVTKFKGKKIGYIAIPKSMDLYDSSRNAPNFYHIALECCAKWGVSVCDLNTITPPTKFWGTDYTSDGTHPTYEGYLKYYCDPIEAWMKTLTTGGNISSVASSADLDEKYVLKSDISVRKAKLTLEDGSMVLIDVVVASDGTTIQKYTNKVPTSTDADGNVFNGVGYQTGYRLSSSGAAKEKDYSAVTGFIPAKAGDVIYITDCGWHHATAENYLCAYKADFSFIGAVTSNVSKYGTQIHSSVTIDGGLAIVTLADVADIAYIRVSAVNAGGCEICDSLTLGEDMIITVNEEITD